MLWIKDRPGADVVVRGARVIDPAEGIDAILDVRIDAGTIAAVGESVDANGHRVVDGTGLVLAPAFVDPHVHLRTPGREDEETIASGTAAYAAETQMARRSGIQEKGVWKKLCQASNCADRTQ